MLFFSLFDFGFLLVDLVDSLLLGHQCGLGGILDELEHSQLGQVVVDLLLEVHFLLLLSLFPFLLLYLNVLLLHLLLLLLV